MQLTNDNHEPLGYDKVAKSADLTTSNAPEDEKIRAMMSQSTQDYDPSRYVKQRSMTGPIPPTYLCFRCGRPGHWIKNCPTNAVEVKRSTGIPRSFMVAVDGPDVPGALLTSSGQFAVPVIDHEAYKEGKKERPPFAKEPTPEKEVMPQIPEELQCMICRDLLVDAVLIPCCGNSYCDECVRQTLLDSEEHECPTCHEKDISPDTLIPNRFLRTAVLSFKNETGYTKARKPVAAAVPEPETQAAERTISPVPPAKSTPPPMLPITCHQPIVLSIKTQLTEPEQPAASTVSDPPLQLQASPLPEDDRPDTPVTDERPHDSNAQEEARGTSLVKEEKSPGAAASPHHHDSDNSQPETAFTIATITTRGPGCVMPPLSPGYPSGPKPPRPKTGPPSARELPPTSSSHRHSSQRYDSPPPHHRESRDSMYMKDSRNPVHHSSYGPPPPYSHHPPQGQHHSAPLPPSHLHPPPQHYPPRSNSSVPYHAQQPPPPINHSGMLQGPPSSMPPVLGHQPPPPGLAPLPPRPVYGPPPQTHHLHPHPHGQGQNDPYHHPHHQMQSHHSNLPHARPHPHSHIGPPHPHGPPMMVQHPPHMAQHPQQIFPPQQHMGPPVSMHKDADFYAQHRAYHDRSRGPYDPMDNFARELFDYHRREEHGGPPPGVVTQGQSPSGHHGPMQAGRSRRPRSTSRSPYSSRSSYRSRSRSRTHSRSRSTSRSRSRSRRRPASRSRSFSYSSHSRSRSRSRTPRSRSRSFSGSSRSRSHSSGRYAKSRSRSPRSRARHYSPTGYRRSRSSRHHHHHHRREFGNRGQGNVPQQTGGILPLPVLTNVFPTPPERNQRPYQDFRYGAPPNAPPLPNTNYRYPGEMGYDGRYDQRYPQYPNRADNFYNPNDNRGHHRSWSPNTTPLNPAGMPPTITTGGRDDQRGRPRSGDVRRGGHRGSSRSPVPRQNSKSPTPAPPASSGRGAPVADARESSKNKEGHHYRRSGKERRRDEPQEMRENTQKRDEGKSHAKKSERKEESTEASTRVSGEKSKGHVPAVTSSDKGVTRTKDKDKKHKHRSSKTVDTQGNVTKVSKKKATKKSSSSADEVSNGDNSKDAAVTADSKQSKGSGDRKKKRKKEREAEQDIAGVKEEPVPNEEPVKEIADKVPEEDTVLETIPETQETPSEITNEQLVNERDAEVPPVEPAKVLPEGFQRTFVEVAPEELKVQAVPFVIPTLYDDLPPETATVNQAFVSEEGREEDMEAEDEEVPDELNENVLTAPVPELSKWELEESEGGANSPNQTMGAAAASGNPSMAMTTRVVVLDTVRGPGSGSGSTLPPDIVQRAEKVIFHKALSAALGPSLMPRPSSGMKMTDEETKRGSGTNTRDGRDREKYREKDKDRQREKEKMERTSRDKEKDEKDVKDVKIKLDRSKFHGKMEVTIGSSNRKVSLKQEESAAMGSEEAVDVKGTEKDRDWRGEEKKHERRTDTKTDASKHRRDIEQVTPISSEKSSREAASLSSSSRKPIPTNRRSRSRSRSKTRTVPSSRRSDQDDKDRQRDKPKPSDLDRASSDRKDVRSRSARSRSRDRSRETDRSRKRDDKVESRDSRKDSPKRVRMVSQERDTKRSSKAEDEKRDRTVDESRGKDGKEGKDGVRDRRKSVLDESKFEPDYDDVNEGTEGGGGGITAKGTKRTWSTSPERNVKMVRRDSEKSVNKSQSGSGSVSGTESTSSQSNTSSDEAAQKKKSKAAKTKTKKNKHKKHKKHKHKHKKKKSHKKKDESAAESAKQKN